MKFPERKGERQWFLTKRVIDWEKWSFFSASYMSFRPFFMSIAAYLTSYRILLVLALVSLSPGSQIATLSEAVLEVFVLVWYVFSFEVSEAAGWLGRICICRWLWLSLLIDFCARYAKLLMQDTFSSLRRTRREWREARNDCFD